MKQETKASVTSKKISTPQVSRKTAVVYGGDIVGFDQLPSSLCDALEKAAERDSNKKIIHIGPDGAETVQTYGELLDEARRMLAGLRAAGLQPGDKIIFQCDLSRDFIPAFWGALLGGFIPVPVSVPADFSQDTAGVLKVRNAWELLNKPLVLTCDRLHTNLRGLERFSEMRGFRSATVETIRASQPDSKSYCSESEELALMMLTSGSTGIPKGVMLTHRNLLARSAGTVQMNGFSAEDISLSWMPLDHVASLIYFHLRDVYTGSTQIHVAPSFILQNPLRWLDLIHRFRATVTFAPNFAFGLVNERAREIKRRHWDLSCVRYFLNGGEAVVPRTARLFMQQLACHGLRPDAMRPAWGMSETSSGVTYGDRFRLNLTSDDDKFAEVGLPIPGVWLRIVNEHDEPVPEGEIGRLQFKGFILMSGYYNNPETNREAFTVDGWFKTGDLGRLQDSRLTITGREKDIIIINGVNYYSHEIESVVEQVHGVEVSFVAACAVVTRNAGERLAVFFSCTEQGKANLPELVSQVRARVAQQNGIKPEYLVPLEKEQFPKTEIGKIQRAKLKSQFEAGEFDVAVNQIEQLSAEYRRNFAPQTSLEQSIGSIWCEVLGLDEVARNETFFAVGGASLAANRVISRIREQLGVELPLAILFDERSTLQEVASFISRQEKGSSSSIQRAADEPQPLSFAQQRIWIAEQMEPGTCRFNVARGLWLKGDVDPVVLQKAFNQVVKQHEILRTRFEFKDGAPRQVVEAEILSSIPVIDLGDLSDPEEVALALARGELSKPLELTATPLFRLKLFQVGPAKFFLSISFHQIIVDGWSIGVLFKELASNYQALAQGGTFEAPEMPIQYRDYAAWQRQQPVSNHSDQLEYWKKQLQGNVARLDWLDDKVKKSVAATERLILPKELCQKLKAFNRRENVTLFMTLLACYKALLRSYNPQDDISVGTAVSGRNRSETESLIGFFVNTVVLRTQVSPGATFRAFLDQVRQTSLQAFAHADLPFEQVVEALRPDRTLEGTPFFQAWFSFMDSMADFKMGEITSTPVHVPPPEAQFDFSLFVIEREDEIDCFFEYKTELLDGQAIRKIMTAFKSLLYKAVENPEASLGALIASTVTAPVVAEPEDFKTIHQWFEYQVRRTPNAIAVSCGDDDITYRNLNRRANQLARYLQKQGVGPDALVGISLGRSREMLVAILGVLKAGGAYVPIDPTYPKERIEQMLSEIDAPVLITSNKFKDRLPVSADHVVCIDSEWEKIGEEPDTNLNAAVRGDNLAYVIFTSGSTGKPKGVLITHQNLVCSNKARFAYYEEPIRAFLMISSFSFDSSVAGIFWTLCSGGNLVLPKDGAHQDPVELIRAIQRNRVSHFLGLPSLYNLMLQEPTSEKMSSLRAVIVAGESCSRDLVDRHARTLSHTRLYNEYGPTEATVWSTVSRLRVGEKVTIGQAIPGAKVYILDEEMNQVADGQAGELFVGGAGVSRGYLNRPEATAAKFVANRFSDYPRERLYRTGDLARILADGNIEFLGRIDHQVKIRGFRIELEEIEAVVAEFPGIRNAVVNPYAAPGSEEKALVAYVVPAANINFRDLRQFLKQRLPDYMVPSAMVVLDALPLMPNGKVDRPALPAPVAEPEATCSYVAPRTPSEEEIAAIWKELLRREQISVHENFFELGGHSLLGIQVMARVRERFQVEIPLKHIFEAPTIAGLAERVFEHLLTDDQVETSNPDRAGESAP